MTALIVNMLAQQLLGDGLLALKKPPEEDGNPRKRPDFDT